MECSVYDGALPPDGTPYPFIYLADTTQEDSDKYKDVASGTVRQIIRSYVGSPESRGDLSMMLLMLKRACKEITRTSNFRWRVERFHQNILPDNTTKHPLLHGFLEVEFSFTKEVKR